MNAGVVIGLLAVVREEMQLHSLAEQERIARLKSETHLLLSFSSICDGLDQSSGDSAFEITGSKSVDGSIEAIKFVSQVSSKTHNRRALLLKGVHHVVLFSMGNTLLLV